MALAPVTLLLLVLTAGSSAFAPRNAVLRNGSRVKRVVGGRKVDISHVPYQARIDHPHAICGGTIIHPSYILTAKHCVAGQDMKRARVAAGSHDGGSGEFHGFKKEEVTRFVRRVVLFPDKKDLEQRRRWLPHDVNPAAVMGDIAILQVEPPFPVDREEEIRPVPLQMKRSFQGGRCELSGWGSTKINDSSPHQLREASVKVFSRKECERREKRLKVDYLCAGTHDGGVDACTGDSGGPLVCDGLLTGIVKGGRGCGESENVSKYTEVALYARWVAETIGLEVKRVGYVWSHTLPHVTMHRNV